MRITIVGTMIHWNALERHYTKHLAELGDTVNLFPFADLIYNYFSRNIIKRINYRFKISTRKRISRYNEDLIADCLSFKPDVVWIFKGVDIMPETLIKIKSIGIKIVNYNADHPFIRTFRSSGGVEIEECVPLYNMHFCYSHEIIAQMASRFGNNIPTCYLPFGFELDIKESLRIHEEGKEEIQRVCFVGSPDNQLRKNILLSIIESKIPLDVYGKGWRKSLPVHSEDINIYDEVNAADYWKTLHRYRVQLNIFRPHNFNSHNMRTFEIPVVGGIQLAPDSMEHRELFEEGKEIFLYNSQKDLTNKAKTLLNLSKYDSEKIRLAARNRCFTTDYSYKNRAKLVKQELVKLIIR